MMLFTIGYEGTSIDMFISLLRMHRVETVVDVRQLPLSRKAGFSKKALARVAVESGLEYVHMAALGCPKPVRDRYRQDGDWKLYTEGFLQHLNEQEAALNGLCDLAESTRCVLVCFEADFRVCHRSMVADAVKARTGADVTHISVAAARTAFPEEHRKLAA